MYLIVVCVKNFAATMTVKVLCLVQSSYEIYDYRLLFIVPISLLRKILKAFQNWIHGILVYRPAYVPWCIWNKFTSFCRVLKEKYTTKIGSFSLPHGVLGSLQLHPPESTVQMASRSVQPFWHGSRLWLTDTQTTKQLLSGWDERQSNKIPKRPFRNVMQPFLFRTSSL